MAFSSSKIFWASADYIPVVVEDLCETLKVEGYEVVSQKLVSGDEEISISKGGFFRSISGMKTALKITLTGLGDRFRVDCKVGIFGQQAVPTIISMLFCWPVMITQIWGLVRQSKLDDHILDLVDEAIKNQNVVNSTTENETGSETNGQTRNIEYSGENTIKNLKAAIALRQL